MLEFTQNRKCIFEYGAFHQLGAVSGELGKRALIVCYPSVNSLVELALSLLQEKGVAVCVYDQILPEPTLECIENGYRAAREFQCDLVIGIGGGSVLDSAKAIAMLMTNGGSLADYQMGVANIEKNPLPMIAVPTTAGTGSEATKTCVVSNPRLGLKKSINHYKLVPEFVILDGAVLRTLPQRILACTGMDALGHAVESYTSLSATTYSRMISGKAIELLCANLYNAYENRDAASLQNILLGSYLAGCGINNAGVGIAHIVGQPLGAVTHKSHGELIGVLLPCAMEFNFQYCTDLYAQIGRIIKPALVTESDAAVAAYAVNFITALRDKLNIHSKLTDLGISALPPREVVLDNIMRSTGHIKINPRPLSEELFWDFIQSAL